MKVIKYFVSALAATALSASFFACSSEAGYISPDEDITDPETAAPFDICESLGANQGMGLVKTQRVKSVKSPADNDPMYCKTTGEDLTQKLYE